MESRTAVGSLTPCLLIWQQCLSEKASYLHRLQHLLIGELSLGSLAACRAEHGLDDFAAVSFKLVIEEESRCVQSFCTTLWHLCGCSETALSGWDKVLVDGEMESLSA